MMRNDEKLSPQILQNGPKVRHRTISRSEGTKFGVELDPIRDYSSLSYTFPSFSSALTFSLGRSRAGNSEKGKK